MKTSAERLWKQIGSQHLKKQNIPKKLKSMQENTNFAIKQKPYRKQQFLDPIPTEQLTLGRIQISQIHDVNTSYKSDEDRGAHHKICMEDDFQFMLKDFNQINDTILVGKEQDIKPSQERDKYLQACRMFKTILFYLKQQILFIQKLVSRQVQKLRADIVQNIKIYNKIKNTLQNKINQEHQINILKIQQLSKSLQQKTLVENKLNYLHFQYEEKVKKIVQFHQDQRRNFSKQLELLIKEKNKVIKQNEELSEKIFDLEQNIMILKQQNSKKTDHSYSKNILQDVQKIKYTESSVTSINKKTIQNLNILKPSPSFLKTLQKQQDEEQLSPQAIKSNNKVSSYQSSGLWQIHDEDNKKRTYSFNHLGHMKSSLHHEKNTSIQDTVKNKKTANYSTNIGLKKLLSSQNKQYSKQKVYSANQNRNLLSQIESYRNLNMQKKYELNFIGSNPSQIKLSQKVTNNSLNQGKKKQDSIKSLDQKLAKIRLEIEGQIKNLKSSMTTHT